MSGLGNTYDPITEVDFLMGRERLSPLDDTKKANMKKLLSLVAALLKQSKLPYYGVSSGYRPPAVNKSAGGAKSSAHMSCEAIDLRDPNGLIAKWCQSNEKVLIEKGLYLEHPKYTPGWCHLQTRPTKSGKHVFIP